MKKLVILSAILFCSVVLKAQTTKSNKNVATPNTPAHVNTDDGYKKWNKAMDNQAKDVQNGKKTVKEGKKEIDAAPEKWKAKRAN